MVKGELRLLHSGLKPMLLCGLTSVLSEYGCAASQHLYRSNQARSSFALRSLALSRCIQRIRQSQRYRATYGLTAESYSLLFLDDEPDFLVWLSVSREISSSCPSMALRDAVVAASSGHGLLPYHHEVHHLSSFGWLAPFCSSSLLKSS